MNREDIKSMALKSEVSMYGIGATYQGLDASEGDEGPSSTEVVAIT